MQDKESDTIGILKALTKTYVAQTKASKHQMMAMRTVIAKNASRQRRRKDVGEVYPWAWVFMMMGWSCVVLSKDLARIWARLAATSQIDTHRLELDQGMYTWANHDHKEIHKENSQENSQGNSQ